MVDVEFDVLFSEILDGNVDSLSEKEGEILLKNKKEIISHLNVVLPKEVNRLLKGENCESESRFYWSLRLAGFIGATEVFQWVEKLCYISVEVFDRALGDCFITEDLSYLIADTMSDWNLLKGIIENPSLDEFIRRSCLDALVMSVAKGNIERIEVTDYFKDLFRRIFEEELDDFLSTGLISACLDLWPGECMEEIREMFGFNLVDESDISIDDVLLYFSRGKEYCINGLQKKIKQHDLIEELSSTSKPLDASLLTMLEKAIQVTSPPKEPERNEACSCGSGKKYKKCCMNNLPAKIRIEKCTISYEPLRILDEFNAISDAEREAILALYHEVQEDPEEVIEKALRYIEKYPNIPLIYNYLYVAYGLCGYNREAINLVKEMVRLFPDYLFGRIEYGRYLLRRGEPDLAFAALNNATTLTQLYPERDFFHVSEWKSFAYFISLYWIFKNDLKQATTYLGLIKDISPRSPEIADLERKIRTKTFRNAHQLS
jgi:tetratricopeptide (TPR) repeat protein